MSKSVTLKREVRFKQWVKQYNARPENMIMTAWCRQNDISISTFATRLHKVQECCSN